MWCQGLRTETDSEEHSWTSLPDYYSFSFSSKYNIKIIYNIIINIIMIQTETHRGTFCTVAPLFCSHWSISDSPLITFRKQDTLWPLWHSLFFIARERIKNFAFLHADRRRVGQKVSHAEITQLQSQSSCFSQSGITLYIISHHVLNFGSGRESVHILTARSTDTSQN